VVYIVGINPGHNCSACLLKDGRIIAAAEEEKFSRIKNHMGFPLLAVNFLLNCAKIGHADLDQVILGSRIHDILNVRSSWNEEQINEYHTHAAGSSYSRFHHLVARLLWRGTTLADMALRFYNWSYWRFAYPSINRNQIGRISETLGSFDRERIQCVDHHMAHGYAGYYGVAYVRPKDCVLLRTTVLVMTHAEPSMS